MRRREFLGGLAGVAAAGLPHAASAQTAERVRRIGLLQGLSATDSEWPPRLAAFTQALAALGWQESHNLKIEARYADGNPARLPALASELVHAQVDLIVTNAAQSIEAARAATSTIPIVMASVGDALGAGYVESLARPGRNVTGLTLFATEQSGKRLELVKEMSPRVTRVAVIWNGRASGHRLQIEQLQAAAQTLGMVLQSIPVTQPSDIEAALQSALAAEAQALITMDDPMIQLGRNDIVELAIRHRLPFMGEFRAMPAAGALMSYGPSQIDMWRRSAVYVDKILRGGNPAELPVEQPAKFELVINLKTAKALGVDVPLTMLYRADEVIE